MLKSGKLITGLSTQALKHFGINSSVSGWETQLADKAFSAEPINAMAFIPPGALKLSKVFETIKDMHGSLRNTDAGIEAIARSKIMEAKAVKAVEKRYQERLERRRKSGKDFPFDLKKRAAKDEDVVKKLNRYGAEIQYIISDSIEKGDAKFTEKRNGAILSEFKDGEKVLADDGSNRVFVKKKLFGRPTWVLFEGE